MSAQQMSPTPPPSSPALIANRSDAPIWPTFFTTLFHVVALTTGFLILISVFDFPDVLREPAADRLAKFMAGFDVIVPTYYLLALTGLSQAVMAVLICLCAPRRDEPALAVATMFGVLCGAFQVAGFIRWSIVMPYLAAALSDAATVDAQTSVVLVEGLINRYGGMAIGEHLGFLCMGLWTLLLSIGFRQQAFVDRRLAIVGIVLGVLSIAMAMEPLGGPFASWGELVAGVMGVWTTWLALIAISLLRGRHDGSGSTTLPPWIWLIALIYALAAAVPPYLG